MLRVLVLLSLISSGACLKKPRLASPAEPTEAEAVNKEKEASLDAVSDLAQDVLDSGPREATKTMAGISASQNGKSQTVVAEPAPILHDLDGTIDAALEAEGALLVKEQEQGQTAATTSEAQDVKAKESEGAAAPVVHDLNAPVAPAATKTSLARSHNADSDGESAGRFWSLLMMLVIGGGAAGAVKLLQIQGAKEQEQPLMASSVSLGVKARAAPTPLPKGITEVDVLETFDSYDKARKGYIEREIVEGLLGPDEVAQGKAFDSIGAVEKLFYHDFRKLVLQAGPVQNAVVNSASRKRGAPIELGSMNQ